MTERLRFFDGDPTMSLEQVLRRDGRLLEAVIQSEEVLTPERLTNHDPQLALKAQRVQESALQWPDADSCVAISPDSSVLTLTGDAADMRYITPIATNGSTAYNNFYALLASPMEEPSEGGLQRIFAGNLMHLYGTKPYLVRAHALFPEFMNSLHREVSNANGMVHYNEQLIDGYLNPEFNRSEAAMLTGSRIAYVLMARLMRRDDIRIQHAMFRLPVDGIELIDDPVEELRS